MVSILISTFHLKLALEAFASSTPRFRLPPPLLLSSLRSNAHRRARTRPPLANGDRGRCILTVADVCEPHCAFSLRSGDDQKSCGDLCACDARRRLHARVADDDRRFQSASIGRFLRPDDERSALSSACFALSDANDVLCPFLPASSFYIRHCCFRHILDGARLQLDVCSRQSEDFFVRARSRQTADCSNGARAAAMVVAWRNYFREAKARAQMEKRRRSRI